MNEPDIAAVPWYLSGDHYERFRTEATDPESFFDRFEEWQEAAMEHERLASEQGVTLFRICMHWEPFFEWLDRSGQQNDHKGRSLYAYAKAVQLLRGESSG